MPDVTAASPPDDARASRSTGALVLLACAAAYLTGLGGYPLADPDESRCAEIAREMLERGDWVTLTVNYTPYFEKPPLMHWLVAGSMSLFGEREFAVRLVPAVLGVAGMLVAWWLATLASDRRLAAPAACVLATTPCYFAVARAPIVDMLFGVTFAGALTAWLASRSPRRGAVGWAVLAGAFLGLAILAKGPVALVLAAGVLGGDWALRRLYRTERRAWAPALARALPALAVASAVAVPWFLAAQARDPRFLHYYFVIGHFERYTGAGADEHARPLLYYLGMVPLCMLPWALFWPRAVGEWVRELARRGLAAARPAGPWGSYLAAWALTIPAFYSLSSCKLPQYALPAFWPIAVWSAGLLDRWCETRRPAPTAVLGVVGALLGLALLRFGGEIAPDGVDLGGSLAALAFAWCAAGVLAVLGGRLTSRDARMGAVIGAALVAIAGLAPLGRAVISASDVGALVPAGLRPAGPEWTVVQYRCTSPALSFYTRSRAVTIDAMDLRGLGAEMPDADVWHPSDPAHLGVLASAGGPLAVACRDEEADDLVEAYGLTEIGRNRNQALLVNDSGLALLGGVIPQRLPAR